MQIDRTRFLALVGALASSCASGTAPPKAAGNASPPPAATGSASAAPSASASSPRTPPVVAGPHMRAGPCVEGGAVWPTGIVCDDKPYEVDCARLAPPGTCGWATKLQRKCERYGKLVRPGAAAMWIEGYACLTHGDRHALCRWQDSDLDPRDVVLGQACRRADEIDVCTRLAHGCAGLPPSHPQFVEACKTSVGILTDAGIARVEACLGRVKACSANGAELSACVSALGTIDDE